MLIRKNTKAFKTIVELFERCQDRPDREKLIRLYITRAGHSIQDRINVEGIQGDAALFYEMNYNAVLSNLKSSDRQLQESDEIPGIYFFHRTSNKSWDETPFEFDDAIKKEYSALADLPTTRKKEKAEKFVFPSAPVKDKSVSKKGEVPPKKKKEVAGRMKTPKVPDKGPRQPDYKLKHKVEFTALDKVVFRSPQVTKAEVLDYYNKVSDYILPYLKDRGLSIRMLSKEGRAIEYNTAESLPAGVDLPDWVQTIDVKKEKDRALLCNDKNHLLWFVEIGAVEFAASPARTKVPANPDYIVIRLDSDADSKKAIEGVLAAHGILTGLQLLTVVKTDGRGGLEIYLPLDGKSKFDVCIAVAEYICKLIRIKSPELFILQGSDDRKFGKVTLDYSINNADTYLVVPYSMVAVESPSVSTPLLWEDIQEGLSIDNLDHEHIFKILKKNEDPFDVLHRKKVNADSLLKRWRDSYYFLFDDLQFS